MTEFDFENHMNCLSFQLTPSQHQFYLEEGYLIFRQAYNLNRVQSLLAGLERLLDRALSTTGKIRWIDPQRRLPNRIGHMLHPDKYDLAFADWLDTNIIPMVEAILGGAIRHSLFGMLASGGEQPYRTAWHRDLCRPGHANEKKVLQRELFRHTQFNAPLKPNDRFLQIIPASHSRPSTKAEMDVYKRNPNSEMPGQLTVELEPGDIVYYDANLWHRGLNPEGLLRWTMHTAFWRAEIPVWEHESGQQEVMRSPGHLEQMPPLTRGCIQRYLDAYPAGNPISALD